MVETSADVQNDNALEICTLLMPKVPVFLRVCTFYPEAVFNVVASVCRATGGGQWETGDARL